MIKIKIFAIVIVASLCFNAQAQNRKINFEQATFKELLAKAKTQKKMVFLDCYTSWCGPCKQMANKVFTLDKVADFFNGTFVCGKFDMEKGEGKTLAKQYNVQAFPTFLLIDAEGKLIHKVVGASGADDFLLKIKEGLDPQKSISGMTAEYEKGNRKLDLIARYVHALNRDYQKEKAYNVAKDYLNSAPDSEKISVDGWSLLKVVVVNLDSPDFDYINTNKDKLIKVVGDKKFYAVFENAVDESTLIFLKRFNAEKLKWVREKIQTLEFPHKAVSLKTLVLAEEKEAGRVADMVANLEELHKMSEFNMRDKFRTFLFTFDTIAKNGSKEDIVKTLSLFDAYVVKIENENAKKIATLQIREPLQKSLDSK